MKTIDEILVFIIFVTIILLMIGTVINVKRGEEKTRELIAQCEADGKKHYECVALLKRR